MGEMIESMSSGAVSCPVGNIKGNAQLLSIYYAQAGHQIQTLGLNSLMIGFKRDN